MTALAEPTGHRERLIAAIAAAIEEKGYRDTTVADVVRIARTSRRNFYEHFADRDACFLALFDATNDAMMRQITDAVRPDEPLDRQVDQAVYAYIGNVAAQPALYRSFVRELPGLGQAGADRGLGTLERFARMLVGFVESGRRAQPEKALNGSVLAWSAGVAGHCAAAGPRHARAARQRRGDRQGDPQRRSADGLV